MPGNPAAGRAVLKDRINAIALAPADDFRRDSDLFVDGRATPRRSAGSGPRWGAGSRHMMEKWHCRKWSVTSPSVDTGETTQPMNGTD